MMFNMKKSVGLLAMAGAAAGIEIQLSSANAGDKRTASGSPKLGLEVEKAAAAAPSAPRTYTYKVVVVNDSSEEIDDQEAIIAQRYAKEFENNINVKFEVVCVNELKKGIENHAKGAERVQNLAEIFGAVNDDGSIDLARLNTENMEIFSIDDFLTAKASSGPQNDAEKVIVLQIGPLQTKAQAEAIAAYAASESSDNKFGYFLLGQLGTTFNSNSDNDPEGAAKFLFDNADPNARAAMSTNIMPGISYNELKSLYPQFFDQLMKGVAKNTFSRAPALASLVHLVGGANGEYDGKNYAVVKNLYKAMFNEPIEKALDWWKETATVEEKATIQGQEVAYWTGANAHAKNKNKNTDPKTAHLEREPAESTAFVGAVEIIDVSDLSLNIQAEEIRNRDSPPQTIQGQIRSLSQMNAAISRMFSTREMYVAGGFAAAQPVLTPLFKNVLGDPANPAYAQIGLLPIYDLAAAAYLMDILQGHKAWSETVALTPDDTVTSLLTDSKLIKGLQENAQPFTQLLQAELDAQLQEFAAAQAQPKVGA